MLHPLQNNTDGNGKEAQKAPINLDDEREKYKALYEAANDGEQIPRNQLQNKIIELSDDVCEKHKSDVIGSAASINLLTGVGATVFSSLAAIVTGAAATNYATGATILNGTKTAVSAEVYQGLFATAIIKAINESRDKKKNEMLAHSRAAPGCRCHLLRQPLPAAARRKMVQQKPGFHISLMPNPIPTTKIFSAEIRKLEKKLDGVRTRRGMGRRGRPLAARREKRANRRLRA